MTARVGPLIVPVTAALLLAGACSPSSNVRFVGAATETVWPAPPDPPRVRYLGEIASSADLNPDRTAGERIADAIFGKEDPVGMVSPLGVATDGAGTIFIADSGAQAVHVYDLERQRYRQWAPPEGAPRLLRPVAVAYDPGGRVLVSDAQGGAIQAFSREGRHLGVLGTRSLRRPSGLAVHRSGEIYVADPGTHEIVVLTKGGDEARRFGGRGGGEGHFNFPTNVAFDSRDRLYVSDSLNFRVQVFAPDGSFERTIGAKGDIPGTFSQPKGIALDPDDHLYVVDANFEAVQIFDDRGRLLLTFGREGHGPGEFWLPTGACFDRAGRLLIADSFNRRVQLFQYLAEGESP